MTIETRELFRYFIISSFSHVILLGLLFIKDGIDDRDKMMTFYEKNIVVDMIPLNENATLQDNSFTDRHSSSA